MFHTPYMAPEDRKLRSEATPGSLVLVDGCNVYRIVVWDGFRYAKALCVESGQPTHVKIGEFQLVTLEDLERLAAEAEAARRLPSRYPASAERKALKLAAAVRIVSAVSA